MLWAQNAQFSLHAPLLAFIIEHNRILLPNFFSLRDVAILFNSSKEVLVINDFISSEEYEVKFIVFMIYFVCCIDILSIANILSSSFIVLINGGHR